MKHPFARLGCLADEDCNAPMDHRQPREAVRQMATRDSGQIQ